MERSELSQVVLKLVRHGGVLVLQLTPDQSQDVPKRGGITAHQQLTPAFQSLECQCQLKLGSDQDQQWVTAVVRMQCQTSVAAA